MIITGEAALGVEPAFKPFSSLTPVTQTSTQPVMVFIDNSDRVLKLSPQVQEALCQLVIPLTVSSSQPHASMALN